MDACDPGKGTCVHDVLSGSLLIRAVVYARPAYRLEQLACGIRTTAIAPSLDFGQADGTRYSACDVICRLLARVLCKASKGRDVLPVYAADMHKKECHVI